MSLGETAGGVAEDSTTDEMPSTGTGEVGGDASESGGGSSGGSDGSDGGQASGGDPGCFSWSGAPAINDAIEEHDCVEVEPGVYEVTGPVIVRAGKILRGASDDRSAATFVAGPGFSGGQLVTDDLGHGEVAGVETLTFDAAGRTNGVGTRYMALVDLEIKNASCWGVGVAGPEFSMDGCDVHHNGADPGCPSAPGGGVYIVTQEEGPGRYAPVITNNTIRENTGPGFDIAGVWDGVLQSNDIHGNSHWAAVSLFGSHWEISDNEIYHPAANAPGIPDGQPYWGECRGGPNGVHPAAIMVCQRDDENNRISVENDIHDNAMASYHGVQLIGGDESELYWVPRNNRILDNDLFGSTVACIDDYDPNQWDPNDANVWTGCDPQFF